MEETPKPQTYAHQVTAEGGVWAIAFILLFLVLGALGALGIMDTVGDGTFLFIAAGVIALLWFGWTWAYKERRKLRGLPPLW